MWVNTLSFFLFFGLLFPFSPYWKKKYDLFEDGGRRPSSQASGCYRGIDDFLKETSLQGSYRWWQIWKRWDGSRPFDRERFFFLREQYSLSLRKVDSVERVELSPEGVLAYIEALSKKRGLTHPRLKKLGFFSRRGLQKIANKISQEKKIDKELLENFSAEIYLNAYGPAFGVKDLFSSYLGDSTLKKKALVRILQEDISRRGLESFLAKKHFFSDRPKSYQKFARSKLGRSLGIGLFNLPVFIGVPPLFLPSMRPFRISENLAQELINKGLSDELLDKLERELATKTGKPFSLRLENRARYEILKRYYMRGALIYLAAFGLYETYRFDEELDEEAKILQVNLNKMTDELNTALELDSDGYFLFPGDSRESDAVQKGEIFCQAIESCLDDFGEEGHLIEKVSDEYKACQKFMDPDNRCTRL